MKDRLADSWSGWIDAGLPLELLVTLLALAGVVWLTSTVLTAHVAARHHRSPFGWSFMVAIVPVLVLCLALVWPGSFPWIAAAAGVAGALLAVLARSLIHRADSTCNSGHRLAPDWVHCPRCPPAPPAAPAPARYAARMPEGPLHIPMAIAAAPGLAQGYAPAAPRHQEPPAKAMIRLIPETDGPSAHVVSVRGALLGRNPSADIPLDDQGASWDHARIVERGGSPAVLDLGSSNGTFVNEERVETSLLIPGDRLRIGETIFKVVS